MKTISFARSLIMTIFVLIVVIANCQLEATDKDKFYLTKTKYDGSHILHACVKGYHTASLWEILDVSNLQYDTELGAMGEDSGSGPPSGGVGWIRTGWTDTDSSATPGFANCNIWTSNSSDDNGTVVYLNPNWQTAPSRIIDPWEAGIQPCSEGWFVWCVQDP
jgi:hypothetical protein